MKYADGREVRLGDRVSLGQDDQGRVVALVDEGEFDVGHPRDEWSYLKTGMIVEFPSMGRIHYENAEADLVLVDRKK